MIHGGWEYVCASYVLTWLTLGGYAFSLWRRHRNLTAREPNGDGLQ